MTNSCGAYVQGFRYSSEKWRILLLYTLNQACCNHRNRFTVPTVQQNGKLEPSTLSLSIPDSTHSCTPVLANRGYSGALYRFSMNHWQWSLPTETGAKCNLISACINHPVLFFGCTICLEQCWFRGRCTVPPKKKGWRGRGAAKCECQGL